MTVTDIRRVVGNYADSVWYGARDANGKFIGPTATVPTAGDQDGGVMSRWDGVQDFPLSFLDPDTPSQPGDGGTLVRFINKPTELPASSVSFGESDMDLMALSQGTKVVTKAGAAGTLMQPYNPTFQDLIVLAVAPGKAMDSSEASMWEAALYFNVNLFPKARNGFNTGNLPTYDYNVVANYAEAYPWGEAFTLANEGDTKGVAWYFSFPYRPILQMWQLDGIETTFNLAKNIALDSADNIFVYIDDGTTLTWATGAPSAGEFGITEASTDTLTIGGAGSSGDYLYALYGWSGS